MHIDSTCLLVFKHTLEWAPNNTYDAPLLMCPWRGGSAMSHLVNQEGQFGLLQICWVPLLPVVAAVDAPPVAAVVDAALVAG
jgi:hypothetical protein